MSYRSPSPRPTRATLEPLEPRALLAATVTGTLHNLYPDSGGAPVTTPLALRRIYADTNNNSSFDANEPSTLTNLDGSYTLSLPPGPHTLRAALKPGWTPASTTINLPDHSNLPAPTLLTSMTNPTVVDVATFYTDSSISYQSLVPAYFKYANQAMANSDTNVRLNLVATRPVSYAPSGSLGTDLARLASAGDAHLDSVHSTRDQLGADLVVLFNPTASAGSGLAYLAGSGGGPRASFGFAVIGTTGNPDFDAYIFAHELGHTLGADHDASNRPGSPAPYARGHSFTAPDGTLYHDVMAYPPGTALPFYSTPNFSLQGRPLGDPNVADNARAIRQTAPAVASYRASKSPAPSKPITAPAPSLPLPALPATPATPPASPFSTTTLLSHTRRTPKSKLTATTTVRNNAATKFTGRLRITYYLSTDTTLDPHDKRLRQIKLPVRNLRPGSSFTTRLTFRLPKSLPAGPYYILTSLNTPPTLSRPPATPTPLTLTTPKPLKRSPFQPTHPILQTLSPS